MTGRTVTPEARRLAVAELTARTPAAGTTALAGAAAYAVVRANEEARAEPTLAGPSR
jgi:hypothetical protein